MTTAATASRSVVGVPGDTDVVASHAANFAANDGAEVSTRRTKSKDASSSAASSTVAPPGAHPATDKTQRRATRMRTPSAGAFQATISAAGAVAPGPPAAVIAASSSSASSCSSAADSTDVPERGMARPSVPRGTHAPGR